MADLTGKILKGRYRVEEYIDRGGMSEVYRVTDLQRGIAMAMKVLRADLAEDKVFLNRFKKEARNLAELQHPNIVRFYSLEQEGRLAFILLDFIEGSTLRAILADDDQPMRPDRILQILEPVCKALHYAHLEKRVHCDVKPSNIMVDNKNNVYLADFGIMRHMDTSTMTLEGMGTPAYMAPELIRNEKPTPQTDIYSLGIVLYEMLTGGKRPFIGEKATISGTTGEKVRWEQLHVQSLPPSKYNKKISRELDQFVLKCLKKEPQERFASMADFINRLKCLLVDEGKVSEKKQVKPEKRTLTPIRPVEHKRDEARKPDKIRRVPRWVWGVAGLAGLLIVVFSLGGGVASLAPKQINTPTPTPTKRKDSQPVVIVPTVPLVIEKTKVKVCEVTDIGGIDDSYFNTLGWAGIQQAIKDLGVEGKYIESKQPSDYAPNLAACKNSGAELIISGGFLLVDDTEKAAKANPDQKYAIFDVGSTSDTPNLLGSVAQIDQNSFLAGYLSAGMTKNKTIGTYVGILFPGTQAFMDGYYLGMMEYNKVHGTRVKLLGFDPAKPTECLQTGNFSSIDDGRKMAQILMDAGADIIMPVAGSVGRGSAAYMKEKGQGLLIGVDQDRSLSSDDYPDYILASVVKRFDVFVYHAIQAIVKGTFKGGSDYNLTLANKGVPLVYGSKWADKIPAELKAEIEALIPKIISGKIKTLP